MLLMLACLLLVGSSLALTRSAARTLFPAKLGAQSLSSLYATTSLMVARTFFGHFKLCEPDPERSEPRK